MSHCVNYTVRDIVEHWPKDERNKITLLRDCASSVPGFEAASEKFIEEMVKAGVILETSENVALWWENFDEVLLYEEYCIHLFVTDQKTELEHKFKCVVIPFLQTFTFDTKAVKLKCQFWSWSLWQLRTSQDHSQYDWILLDLLQKCISHYVKNGSRMKSLVSFQVALIRPSWSTYQVTNSRSEHDFQIWTRFLLWVPVPTRSMQRL